MLDWNEPSIGFYRGLGPGPWTSGPTFRLDGTSLAGSAARGAERTGAFRQVGPTGRRPAALGWGYERAEPYSARPRPRPDSEIERALVVTAHPDDADYGAAGTIAGWIDAGIEVTLLLCTRGEQGGFDDTPRRADAGDPRARAAGRVRGARRHRRPLPGRLERRLAGADAGTCSGDRRG